MYPMLKPEISVQMVAERDELIPISMEYAVIHSKSFCWTLFNVTPIF
jgi:hypothetical protein